jgi:hypothetical protein
MQRIPQFADMSYRRPQSATTLLLAQDLHKAVCILLAEQRTQMHAHRLRWWMDRCVMVVQDLVIKAYACLVFKAYACQYTTWLPLKMQIV